MKISEIVALNLKRIRLKLELTQEEAAFRCNISVRHYINIENNKTNLSINTLNKLSYGLGVTHAELVKLYGTAHVLNISCIESKITIEGREIPTFGIRIEVLRPGGIMNVINIEDISTDMKKVHKLSSVLNRLQPSIVHIDDVLDDYLVDLEM